MPERANPIRGQQPLHHQGMRVVSSPYAVEWDSYPVRRTWRERLFSWPWRPWAAMRNRIVSRPGCFRMGNTLYMHPELVAELRATQEVHHG